MKIIPFLIITLLFACSTGSSTEGSSSSSSQNTPSLTLTKDVTLIPDSFPSLFQSTFNKYAQVIAPNGEPIHIFSSSGVSTAQTARAKRILEFILKDVPNSKYGSNKAAIANSMADKKATLLYFDTEEQSLTNREKFSDLGFGVQDLYANESSLEGSIYYMKNTRRDSPYEEIFHMVQNFGIQHAAKEFHLEILAAEKEATKAGIYKYNNLSDNPELNAFEYIVSCIDVYYGLWAHLKDGPSYDGEFTPWTPANLKTITPRGHTLVESFFPPFLDWDVHIDETFASGETFSLKENDTAPYTLKSKFIKNITLTGSNSSNLRGNAFNNMFVGNEGKNTVYFSGKYNEYKISTQDAITEVEDSIKGRDGIDTLKNIEFLQFTDKLVTL